MRIFLISDNHAYQGPEIMKYARLADEIWHAGDWLNSGLIEELEKLNKPLRSVWGNVDGHEIRKIFPLHNIFIADGLKVFMIHIGGYPGRYNPKIKELLAQEQPDIMVTGHSHILKVMRDKTTGMLSLNPGACGVHGFHKMRTALQFHIENGKISNMEVIEFGLRGTVPDDWEG
jgi:hypothetical protein